MIAAHQFQSERNTWPSRNLGAVYHNAASPRMSNFDSLAAQQEWREHYSSTAPPVDNNSYDSPPTNSPDSIQNQMSRDENGNRHPEQLHSFELSNVNQETSLTRPGDRTASAPGECQTTGTSLVRPESQTSPRSVAFSQTSEKQSAFSSATTTGDAESARSANSNTQVDFKDEDLDDEEDEDDDMLDAEEGAAPLTAAERRAERRKMKRFRLTHQQTRFLMSEFAKQAHPDAAHRERLSREIPGLSPRQVQVWFQNRRAKIKRLTVDDRERMMKMRAVPDDFDNVQALHSPYGAVHGINTPMQSPSVDFVPAYAEQMMRPLMVENVRRHGTDQMSPGLSPGYGNMGYAPSGSIGTSDTLSPLSMTSNDRYFPNQMSSPTSADPRSASMFHRQNSSDNYHGLSSSRQNVRPLQPLQVRTAMSRSRSDSLQSPLRSSMSWKGENLDYGFSQPGQPSPQLSGRQQSTYHGGEQIGNNRAHYDDTNLSPYPTSHGPTSASHTSSPSSLSRLRATSSAFPPGLDLRNQYRNYSSQQHHGIPPTPRSGSSFAGNYTSGFASAPLSAPVDFSLPRTPADPGRDFHAAQMSAPMAPPADFSQAYSSTIRPQHSDGEYAGQVQTQSPSPGRTSEHGNAPANS